MNHIFAAEASSPSSSVRRRTRVHHHYLLRKGPPVISIDSVVKHSPSVRIGTSSLDIPAEWGYGARGFNRAGKSAPDRDPGVSSHRQGTIGSGRASPQRSLQLARTLSILRQKTLSRLTVRQLVGIWALPPIQGRAKVRRCRYISFLGLQEGPAVRYRPALGRSVSAPTSPWCWPGRTTSCWTSPQQPG